MIDVDRFKAYNDCYGHPVGDQCLKGVAEAISSSVRRPGDVAARYGGEEFAVILPATDEAGALSIAAHIREAVLRLAIEHKANELGLVTISAGVAVVRPASLAGATAGKALLLEADRALYPRKKRWAEHRRSCIGVSGNIRVEAVSSRVIRNPLRRIS